MPRPKKIETVLTPFELIKQARQLIRDATALLDASMTSSMTETNKERLTSVINDLYLTQANELRTLQASLVELD